MRVIANVYSAEYGRNSGAQVLTVSQNGTNEFHGSLFLKNNSPGLNSFNKYGGPNNAPRIRVNQHLNQYGGSIGGPLPIPNFGEGNGRRVLRLAQRQGVLLLLLRGAAQQQQRHRQRLRRDAGVPPVRHLAAGPTASPRASSARKASQPRIISVVPATCASRTFPTATSRCASRSRAASTSAASGARRASTSPSPARAQRRRARRHTRHTARRSSPCRTSAAATSSTLASTSTSPTATS